MPAGTEVSTSVRTPGEASAPSAPAGSAAALRAGSRATAAAP